jgi:thioredoxin-related protein
MNNKKLLLNCLLFLTIAFLPACSNTSSQEKPAEKPEAAKQEAAHDSKEEKDLPVLKEGDNLKAIIKSIKVKNIKGKEKSLKDFMGSEKTLITVVKPGCVFCESMLAIKSALGISTKAKFLVILDASHTDFKGFKEKYEKFKSAGGEWLFDINDDMEEKFGINSFPRFLLIDKAGNLEKYQTGLFMPEDKTVLEEKSFPEALQILSEETARWMQSL